VPSWPVALAWSTLTVQGPMGRTVADVALQLSVLAGPDPRAPLSLGDDGSGFAAPLPTDLRGVRVAWAPDLGGRIPVDPAVTAVLEPAVRVFADLGAHVEADCPDLTGADDVFGTLRAWQFDAAFTDLVRRHPGRIKETIRWNAAAGAKLSGADVSRAEAEHTRLHQRIVGFFDHYDVLLAPTAQVLPFPVELEYPTEIAGQPQENYLEWMRSCTLLSPTGCPAISVPAGFTPDGLPVGLQVVAAPRADRRLLEIAHAFEQATRFGERRPAL
jgi:amidase